MSLLLLFAGATRVPALATAAAAASTRTRTRTRTRTIYRDSFSHFDSTPQQRCALHTSSPDHFLWRNWLRHVWNRKDESRLDMIGPDRLACEWVLRMEGRVTVTRNGGPARVYRDYNSLPWLQVQSKNQLLDISLRVIEIDLSTGDDIQDPGLQHIENLDSLKTLSLRNCTEITDKGLEYLQRLPALHTVDLSGTAVTPAGVIGLLHAHPSIANAVVGSSLFAQGTLPTSLETRVTQEGSAETRE